jgi:Holliday junction resolvase RusA-like endonuclease
MDAPISFDLHIAGDPVPKARARVTKSGVAFTPAKTRRWEQTAALMAQQEMRGRALMTGPVEVVVLAAFGVPQSWPTWKRAEALIGGVAHTGRPDADNLAKAATDALNGVVFRDDSQIVSLITRKTYAETPGVTIKVSPVVAFPSQARRRDCQ